MNAKKNCDAEFEKKSDMMLEKVQNNQILSCSLVELAAVTIFDYVELNMNNTVSSWDKEAKQLRFGGFYVRSIFESQG